MNFRLAAACAALVSVAFAQPPAPTMPRPRIGKPPILPVSQVKKGMQAIAWTVFEGTEPEAVPVEIIGVWKNANGPKADVILGRMGGKAQRTNVAGGMSGSPVYVDGKLIGAIALRLSFFSPDAICGITPIESMLEINDLDASKPAQRAAIEVPAELLAGSGIPAQQSLTLQPIDTPLSLSGAHPDVFPYFNGIFKSQGLQLAQGGSTAALKATTLAPDWKTALNPGDTVSMILVSGDVNISSGCTLLYLLKLGTERWRGRRDPPVNRLSRRVLCGTPPSRPNALLAHAVKAISPKKLPAWNSLSARFPSVASASPFSTK